MLVKYFAHIVRRAAAALSVPINELTSKVKYKNPSTARAHIHTVCINLLRHDASRQKWLIRFLHWIFKNQPHTPHNSLHPSEHFESIYIRAWWWFICKICSFHKTCRLMPNQRMVAYSYSYSACIKRYSVCGMRVRRCGLWEAGICVEYIFLVCVCEVFGS